MYNTYQESELIRLIQKRIDKNNNEFLNTTLIGEVTLVNANNTISCYVPSLDIELQEIIYHVWGAGQNYIHLQVQIGTKCLLLVPKYSIEKYYDNNEEDSINYDYNNAFAIIGIDIYDNLNNKNIISVTNGISITNGQEELIDLISQLAELQLSLSQKTSELAQETANITITLAPSGIGIPLNKAAIEAIKVQIDLLNNEIDIILNKIRSFIYAGN